MTNMTTCIGEELELATKAIEKEFNSLSEGYDPKQNNSNLIIRRTSVSIPKIDLLSWLDRQKMYPKVYWCSRDTKHETVCAGSIHTITGDHAKTLQETFRKTAILGDSGCRYFGGLAFQAKINSSDWHPFSAYQFILPEFELTNKNDYETIFVCNIKIDLSKNLNAQKTILCHGLSRLIFDKNPLQSVPLEIESRIDQPSQTDWDFKIDAILDVIKNGSFSKLVLARETTLRCKNKINALSLLADIGDRALNSYRFHFQPTPETAFFGISPERLFLRHKNKIRVEAIAGTSHRGNTKNQEMHICEGLLKSEKVNREHHYVVKNLRQVLNTLNADIKSENQPEIMKLFQLLHLFKEITATLPKDNNDIDTLTALHPTPAVGGYPRQNALPHIDNFEEFDRGWYASPIGWIGRDETEFAVAIRSGLIRGNILKIYNGAGIVEGSTANDEWAEIEMKYSSVISLMSAS